MDISSQSAQRRIGSLCCLAAAIIWGSSFFIVKDTVETFPPNYLVGIRFVIASAALSLVFCRRLKAMNWPTVRAGLLCGVFLYTAYVFQTIGITDTTPGRNAFLTACYCIFVPFFAWAVFRKRPDIWCFIGALVAIIGIGLISLDGTFSMTFGDMMSLICGVFYAMQIVTLSKVTQHHDPVLLCIVQLSVTGIGGILGGACTESLPAASSITWVEIGSVIYLSLVVSALGFLLQNVGQKRINPSLASILLSLEAVFGVLFSVLFYGEALTVKVTIGFALVFAAIVISETKLSFLRKGSSEDVRS